jgi:hypothetical protein
MQGKAENLGPWGNNMRTTTGVNRKSRSFAAAAFRAAFLLLAGISLWSQDLPVRKVVLYKNGLGYFEHDGRVTGNQTVEIVLPSRQLDDVLKSLTVIDRGRGQIAGITYDSAESLDRRLAELPVKVDPSQGLVDFLNKIPGAEVEVALPAAPPAAAPASVAGRLMGAEIRQKKSGEYIIGQTIQVNILTAKGDIRSLELPSSASLKLVKQDLATELRDYLTVLDSAHQRDSRRLKIAATGNGERALLVSYTAESPIWKTTYRLVLDAQHKPLLQGWAIVDNTTANEWEGVELSLVAGQPISFIQNLSQPLYGRRPVIPMAQGFEVTPQTHQATLELPAGASGLTGEVVDPSGGLIPGATVTVEGLGRTRQVSTDDNGKFSVSLDPGTYRVNVRSSGFQVASYTNVTVNAGRSTTLNPTLRVGTVTETVTVNAAAPMMNMSSATVRSGAFLKLAPGAVPSAKPMSDMIRESETETAQAQPVGDQFEYKVRQPVTIHRNQSALLPIANTEMDGEKVVLYNETSGDRRPRLAVWLKNSSGLTLDSGSFSVIDTNSFAGEGLTDTIHPGECRLLSYALDSGLTISSTLDSDQQKVEKVAILHGVMTQTRQAREKKTYVIRNNDDKPRIVVVEHPTRSGWKLIDTPDPAESSAGLYRFRVETRPKTTTELTIQEANPIQTTYEISDVESDEIDVWIKEKTINPEMEKALREVLRLKGEAELIQSKSQALAGEEAAIEKDQGRLRDNLGKLNSGNKDEASLRQRYIKQMEEQEDRLAQIKTESAKLQEASAKAQKAVEDYVQGIAIGN